MNKYVKDYLLRGMLFGGFGPIILGIVYAILEATLPGISLSGREVLLAIISTYAIAFVQAGASVFNQIEEWPLMKSLGFHFLSIYLVYSLAYIINSWIPFDWSVIGIFTAIFVVVYLVIWLIVYVSVRSATKRLNDRV